ncbi:Hypothetical predicted protein [Lecanosticta acicola]|uniref:Oxidoreductase n=1 Tax=Lecanosticta acicola TaxID=111012 RepID=A0AAI8YXW5_9PEZI|nr:Hypothetical predicted protein [Lecanosticta acicola]
MSFNPEITDLSGKVILITGGTAGLGAGSIAELAKLSPAHIFFSGRNQSKADALIQKIEKASPNVKITFIKADISSLESVQQAAETFLSQTDRLDILMLNAGIMAVAPGVSKDGYEIQFATNHLGHALLVKKLLPTLLETAKHSDVRVINMTSLAYAQAPKEGVDFDTLQSPQASLGGLIPGPRWSRYGQSKLTQLLYSQQLALHHPSITSVSIHPGIIMTGLFDDLPFLTVLPVLLMSLGKKTPVEQGHWNQCWAATAQKGNLTNGGYYEPTGVLTQPSTKPGNDQKLAERIWEWTEKALEKY